MCECTGMCAVFVYYCLPEKQEVLPVPSGPVDVFNFTRTEIPQHTKKSANAHIHKHTRKPMKVKANANPPMIKTLFLFKVRPPFITEQFRL